MPQKLTKQNKWVCQFQKHIKRSQLFRILPCAQCRTEEGDEQSTENIAGF